MKRDMELVRKLLIFFDEKEAPGVVEAPDMGTEYSEHIVQYHLQLLCEAGWLTYEAERSTGDRIIRVYPFDLTWEGHEFLAKINAAGVWPKLKQIVASKGGSMAFDVIKQLATKLALEAAGAI